MDLPDLRQFGGLKQRRPGPFQGAIPYLATADVQLGRARPNEHVTFAGRPARAGLSLQSGDVLQAKMRETDKALLVTSEQEGWLASTGFAQFQPVVVGNDPKFLLQLLRSDSFLRRRDVLAVGSTQQAISDRDLGSIHVPELKLVEQQHIAEILEAVDARIHVSRTRLQKLRLVEAGLVEALLTRGVDDAGQHQVYGKPAEGSGLLPPGWRVVRLSDIASVDRGKFGHRPRNDPAYLDGPFPFIQTGDVSAARGGYIRDASQSLSRLGAGVSRQFPANTIAVTIAANIADTTILGRPMYFPDSVVGVTVRAPHAVRFVELVIRSAKPRLEARAPQSAQRNINLQDLRPLAVPLPPPEEQERVASVYEAYSEVVEAEQRLLAKLNGVRKGLSAALIEVGP